MHGLIGYLKQWMQDNKFVTYTLQSLNDKMVRGYFLRDPNSSQALIAQMLPFTQSQPLDLQALQLIYQQGGYWVYKIPGGKEPEAAPAQPTQQSTSTPAQSAPVRRAEAIPYGQFVEHCFTPETSKAVRARQSWFSALSAEGEACGNMCRGGERTSLCPSCASAFRCPIPASPGPSGNARVALQRAFLRPLRVLRFLFVSLPCFPGGRVVVFNLVGVIRSHSQLRKHNDYLKHDSARFSVQPGKNTFGTVCRLILGRMECDAGYRRS